MLRSWITAIIHPLPTAESTSEVNTRHVSEAAMLHAQLVDEDMKRTGKSLIKLGTAVLCEASLSKQSSGMSQEESLCSQRGHSLQAKPTVACPPHSPEDSYKRTRPSQYDYSVL